MNSVEKLITRVRELDAAARLAARSYAPSGDLGLLAEYRTLTPKLAAMLERAMKELDWFSRSSSSSPLIRQDSADAIAEVKAMAEIEAMAE